MYIEIEGKRIGDDCRPYIVAELSANHNGSIEIALRTIKAAKQCGADAIKIQTYDADSMTIDCDKKDFFINGGTWDGYKLYDLYKKAGTPFKWHDQIFDYARKIGITIFSTPFDERGVDLLGKLNTPAFKIASFELCDLPLIKYIAKKNKPIIMSTGISSKEEIAEAVETAKSYGNGNIVLLHCVSSYPAPVNEANLFQIKELSNYFKVPVGLSDHTLGTTVSIASVALGACLIEKHFIVDKTYESPDSAFSISPEQLKHLCKESFLSWQALGKETYKKQKSEEKNVVFKRSIYFIKDLPQGHIITKNDIKRIRPGMGLPPKFFDQIIGKKLLKSVERGQATSLDFFEDL